MEEEVKSSDSLKSFFAKLKPWEAKFLEHTNLAADPRLIDVALDQGIVGCSS